jgi:hypothetical protein
MVLTVSHILKHCQIIIITTSCIHHNANASSRIPKRCSEDFSFVIYIVILL